MAVPSSTVHGASQPRRRELPVDRAGARPAGRRRTRRRRAPRPGSVRSRCAARSAATARGAASSSCRSGTGSPNRLDLQVTDPGDELPAGVLVQPRRAVGGVRRDVAVDERRRRARPAPPGARRPRPAGPARTAPPSRAPSRRRRRSARSRASRASSACTSASYRGKASVAVAGAARGQGAEQAVGERALARPVQALDHDQSSHGRGYCPAPAARRRSGGRHRSRPANGPCWSAAADGPTGDTRSARSSPRGAGARAPTTPRHPQLT